MSRSGNIEELADILSRRPKCAPLCERESGTLGRMGHDVDNEE